MCTSQFYYISHYIIIIVKYGEYKDRPSSYLESQDFFTPRISPVSRERWLRVRTRSRVREHLKLLTEVGIGGMPP